MMLGTTLQLFDVDDEDEREEPAVHRNTEQQPIEAPTQAEQPAAPAVATEEPPPQRYPLQIRRQPDWWLVCIHTSQTGGLLFQRRG